MGWIYPITLPPCFKQPPKFTSWLLRYLNSLFLSIPSLIIANRDWGEMGVENQMSLIRLRGRVAVLRERILPSNFPTTCSLFSIITPTSTLTYTPATPPFLKQRLQNQGCWEFRWRLLFFFFFQFTGEVGYSFQLYETENGKKCGRWQTSCSSPLLQEKLEGETKKINKQPKYTLYFASIFIQFFFFF